MAILDGLKRVAASAKVQLLAVAAFGAVMTYVFSDGTHEEKRTLMRDMVYAIAGLVGVIILGWAHEDAAAKGASQTNIASTVKNEAPPAPVESKPVDAAPVIPEPTIEDHVREMARMQRENATTLNLLLKNIRITKPVAAEAAPTPVPHEPA